MRERRGIVRVAVRGVESDDPSEWIDTTGFSKGRRAKMVSTTILGETSRSAKRRGDILWLKTGPDTQEANELSPRWWFVREK